LSEITALGPDGATRWTYRGCTTSSQSAPAVAADAATLFTCNDGAVISLDDAGHVRWRTALAEVATVSPTIGPSGDFLVKGNDLASLAPDGSIRWRDGNVDSFASDIAVEDGLLFLAGGETVAAYRDDGSLVWLHEENKARFRQVAITAAGTVVTCASDSVVAFSRSGAVLWRAPVKDGRALAADAAGNVFVATFAKTIHALGPDGSVRWTFDTRDELPGGFAIGGDGTLYAFDRKSVYAIR
jgi:outer membrane protein assembly factor BamB